VLTYAPSVGGLVVVTLLAEAVVGVAHAAVALLGMPADPRTGRFPTALRWRPLLAEVRSYWLINLSVTINTRLDVLIAGLAAGPVGASLYRIAERITGYGAILLKQVSRTLLPDYATAAARGDRAAMREMLRYSTRWIVRLGWLPLLLLATWGDWTLTVWAGEGLGQAAWIALLAWIALWISLIQAQATAALLIAGRHRVVSRLFLLVAAVNAGVSVWLGSTFGAVGIAAATLLTVTALDLLWLIPSGLRVADVSLRDISAHAVRGLTKPTLLSLLILGSARLVNPQPELWLGLCVVLLSAAVYTLAILRWSLDPMERGVLSRLIKRIPLGGGWIGPQVLGLSPRPATPRHLATHRR